MRLTNFHAHAELDFLSRSIRIHIFERRQDGDISILSDFQFKTINPSESPEPDDSIGLPLETAQELMDALWQCGLRPSEGSGSAGALKATENHLHDMQEINRRLLTMVETRIKE